MNHFEIEKIIENQWKSDMAQFSYIFLFIKHHNLIELFKLNQLLNRIIFVYFRFSIFKLFNF